MTRSTLILLTRTRRAAILTVKGVLLYIFWRTRAMVPALVSTVILAFAGLIFYNAHTSGMYWLYVPGAVAVWVALYIFDK